jgi:hypothetical protein
MKRVFAVLAISLLLAGTAHKPPPPPPPALEYVIVTYPGNRAVYVDGKQNGKTNDVLRLSRGTYVFDLGAPADYEPASQKVLVKDTGIQPLTIEFKKKGGT